MNGQSSADSRDNLSIYTINAKNWTISSGSEHDCVIRCSIAFFPSAAYIFVMFLLPSFIGFCSMNIVRLVLQYSIHIWFAKFNEEHFKINCDIRLLSAQIVSGVWVVCSCILYSVHCALPKTLIHYLIRWFAVVYIFTLIYLQDNGY